MAVPVIDQSPEKSGKKQQTRKGTKREQRKKREKHSLVEQLPKDINNAYAKRVSRKKNI
jgi:hypothetical protein